MIAEYQGPRGEPVHDPTERTEPLGQGIAAEHQGIVVKAMMAEQFLGPKAAHVRDSPFYGTDAHITPVEKVQFKTIGTMKALSRGDPLTESPLAASRTDVRAQRSPQYSDPWYLEGRFRELIARATRHPEKPPACAGGSWSCIRVAA